MFQLKQPSFQQRRIARVFLETALKHQDSDNFMLAVKNEFRNGLFLFARTGFLETAALFVL
jgi:hypothetical protein